MPGGRSGENSDHGIQPQEVKGYTLNLTEDLDSDPGKLKMYVSDLNTLQSRMTGRSHDLDGAHNDAAQSFTELFKWPITEESLEDLEHWFDTTRAIFICAALTEELADAVEYYKDERARIISRWNTEAPYVLDIEDPIDQVTLDNPVDNATQDITDHSGLINLKDELEEEERLLKTTSVETIEEIAENIKDGEAPDVLARLYEGGYINYGYFNMGGELDEGIPFDINREELPEDMMEYVEGDKEPDDDFYEMVAFLGALGFKAGGAQSHDDVEMAPEDMELLKDLFDHIEEEGDLMGIPDDVQGSLSPEDSSALLGALGGGLLALSDQRLSGGSTSTPGGYYALPESFREAAELEGYNGSSREDPFGPLSQFMGHAPEGLEPGRGLALTLNFTIAEYLETYGDSDEILETIDPTLELNMDFIDKETEKEILDVLDVSLRNERANADLLNGEGMNNDADLEEWYVNPHGDGDMEQERKDTLETLFTHDWDDDGEVVGGLTNWMHENAPDIPAGVSNEDINLTKEQRLAAHALEGFMEVMADDEFYESLSNTEKTIENPHGEDSTWRNVSSAQLNPYLAEAWADLFSGYKRYYGSVFGLEGGYDDWGWNETDDFLYLAPESRLRFAQLFMGEESAARNAYADILENELDAMEYFASGEQSNRSGTVHEAGVLRGLLDEALDREANVRQEKHDEALDYENNVKNNSVDLVGGAVSDIGAPATVVEIFKVLAKGDPETENNESVLSTTDIDSLMAETQIQLFLLSELMDSQPDAVSGLDQERDSVLSSEGEFLHNPYHWDVILNEIPGTLSDAFRDVNGYELNGDSLKNLETSFNEDWERYNEGWSKVDQ